MVDINELMRGISDNNSNIAFDIFDGVVCIASTKIGEIIFYDWVH